MMYKRGAINFRTPDNPKHNHGKSQNTLPEHGKSSDPMILRNPLPEEDLSVGFSEGEYIHPPPERGCFTVTMSSYYASIAGEVI